MYLGLNTEDYWHIDYHEYNSVYNGHNYFWDLTNKAILCKGSFDNRGILEFLGQDGKNYKHVVNIAHYAIGAYELYLRTNEKKWLLSFLKHADWLCDRQTNFKKIEGVWINEYPISLYGLKGGTVSAMTQGFAISVLTRAYLATHNERYLTAAQKAVFVYSINVKNGGVLREISDDFLCYEEYSTIDAPSCVLNGFITAILGLYDLIQVNSYKQAIDLYDKGIKSLSNNLYRWDYNWWSLYDLYSWGTKNVSSYFYHKYHIKQLKVLFKLTGNQIFNEYHKKWQKDIESFSNRFRALIKKSIFRLNGRL